MYNKIMDSILNKKEESLINIATVVTVNPLTIKFPPDTTAIPAISLTNLIGIAINSRVVTLRYGKQFIVFGVIGGSMLSAFKTSDESINNDDSVNSDSELYLDIPIGRWEVIGTFYASCTDVDVDLRMDWATTGDITLVSERTCLGPYHGITYAYNATMRASSYSLGSDIGFGVEGTAEGGRKSVIQDKFVISSATGNGRLTYRWAQYTSSADYLKLLEGSYIKATRI